MNKKSTEAIGVLNKHKAKITGVEHIELWAVETLEYVSKYFPKDSQFEHSIRSVTTERMTGDDFKRKSCSDLMDAMISYIENAGVYEQPKKNILSNLNPELLYGIATGILALGFFFGQLWSNSENKNLTPAVSGNSANQYPDQKKESESHEKHDSIRNNEKDTTQKR
jgi:hypothetical protein